MAGGAAQAWGRPDAKVLDALPDLVNQAVVVCAPSGAVRWCNSVAGLYLPGLRPGTAPDPTAAAPLAQAITTSAAHFSADFLGRRLVGVRRAVAHWLVWLICDETPVSRYRAELRAQRSRVAFLSEAGRRLGTSLHHGRTARAVVELAVPALADTAVLILPPRGGHADWYRCTSAGTSAQCGVLPAMTLERVPELVQALSDLWPRHTRCSPGALDELGEAAPPDPGHEGDSLVVALPGSGASAGALVLVRSARPADGDAEDTTVLRDFAFQAGTALAAAALYAQQAHTLAVLQSGLEPAPLPEIPGIGLGAAYRPAPEAMGVGGDFYQVAAAPDGEGGGADFALGDVCGKGVEAAVRAGHLRQSLRTLALVESRPLRVLDVLNRSLLDADSERFVSMIIGSARPAAGGALDLVLTGGGHLSPLVLRRAGRVEPVEVGGMLVGALPEPEFGEIRVRLEPDESILLYSDGVTEARGGPDGDQEYGAERLKHDLADCVGMPAGAIAERVELRVAAWLTRPARDDVTVLALQAQPARPSTSPRRDD